MGVEIISTGGTARTLEEAGVTVRTVESVTGYPEILGGRVKTLHPAIHGGILAKRDPQHLVELAELSLAPIDLVVVNLYPFSLTVARPGCTLDQALEQIDIGGVTLLRAAAKNFAAVVVLCDPADYSRVIDVLRSGRISPSRSEGRWRPRRFPIRRPMTRRSMRICPLRWRSRRNFPPAWTSPWRR